MTIQGAITELQDLLKANDVPLYYKGGIRKVIKTISMEFVERNRRIEALEHRLELHERAMAKAIQDEAQTHDICTNTHECVKDTHDKTEPTISKMEQVEEAVAISPKEFSEKMQALAEVRDPEESHIKMDDLMCELLKSLGYGEGVDIFEDTEKWYS